MRVDRRFIEVRAVAWAPPHGASHEAHVEWILASLREHGWRGRPLILTCPSGQVDEAAWAWTGSHRAEALRRLLLERESVVIEALLLVPDGSSGALAVELLEIEYARRCQKGQRQREMAAEDLAAYYPCCQLLVDALAEEFAANAEGR